jgi:hypothetical protein
VAAQERAYDAAAAQELKAAVSGGVLALSLPAHALRHL